MRSSRLALLLTTLVPLLMQAASPTPPRFSVALMDTNTSPRVDFAKYAFGKWLADNPIPADKSRWGGFDELAQFNWAALKDILETTAAKQNPQGSVEQKVGDFFASAMDQAAIDAAGLKPIEARLKQIGQIRSIQELANTLAVLHLEGVSAGFAMGVSADQKKSDINALYASQGGTTTSARPSPSNAPSSLPTWDDC
jgi:putative endopeptidase